MGRGLRKMTELELMEALSERLIDENKRQSDRIEELQKIPRSGEFHNRLAKDGVFGLFERMTICRLIQDQMDGKPVVDRTDGEMESLEEQEIDGMIEDFRRRGERGIPGTGKSLKDLRWADFSVPDSKNLDEMDYRCRGSSIPVIRATAQEKKCFECGLPVQDTRKEFCNYCYSFCK